MLITQLGQNHAYHMKLLVQIWLRSPLKIFGLKTSIKLGFVNDTLKRQYIFCIEKKKLKRLILNIFPKIQLK